jgi:uncharacterized protein YegJ (DUF2314 family)
MKSEITRPASGNASARLGIVTKSAVILLLLNVATVRAADESTETTRDAANASAPLDYRDVNDSDKAMDQAVTTARESLGFFLAALQAKKPDTGEFEVKKCFIVGDKVEHIWIRDVNWDGKAFHGRVDNKPLEVGNVHLGERVSVTPEDLTDWMFVKEGKLMGGFTMRVLYSRLSPEEKAEFEKESDFKIE